MAIRASMTAPENAPVSWMLSTLVLMKRVMVSVLPSMAPDTTNTAPNSPSTRAVVRVTP